MNLVLTRSLPFVLLFLLTMTPQAKPASSDGFPWANDRAGTVRLGDISPGSSASASGISQGNIGPTQSGPGPVGLFTPSGPGNAAAYDAQLTGALEGSPIVDGNGVNIQIAVPMSTPSSAPGYLRYTVSATTPGAAATDMNYEVGTTNPTATPGIAPGPFGAITNVFGRTIPGAQALPDMTRIGTGAASNPAASKVSSPSAGATFNITTVHPLVAPVQTMRTTRFVPRQVWHRAEALAVARKRQEAMRDPMALLGRVNGSIRYDDDQIVLFGANGALRVNADHSATLTFRDGRSISLRDRSNTFHQLAERRQIQL